MDEGVQKELSSVAFSRGNNRKLPSERHHHRKRREYLGPLLMMGGVGGEDREMVGGVEGRGRGGQG